MIPAVILHCGFAITAVLLQFFGVVDLPRLIIINNILLFGLAYTIVLTILDAVKGNRGMRLYALFLIIAYITMLHEFYIGFMRRDVVNYIFRDTFFLLILCVLINSIWVFFRSYYRHAREHELLTLQSRIAMDGYENIKSHIHQIGSIKHEINKHLTTMHIFMKDSRYEEAQDYLEKYAYEVSEVMEAVYHDNYLINAVAHYLLQRAKDLDIKTKLNMRASPANISESDLVSLLVNITDNALEACAKIQDGRKRLIELSITRRDPYFVISCTNSRIGKIIQTEKGMQTTKKDGGHGYGLWTIERIAKTYNGLMDVEYNNDTFTIKVALKDE
jgi:hypothetical protein